MQSIRFASKRVHQVYLKLSGSLSLRQHPYRHAPKFRTFGPLRHHLKAAKQLTLLGPDPPQPQRVRCTATLKRVFLPHQQLEAPDPNA